MGIIEKMEERLERIELALANLAEREPSTRYEQTDRPRWLDARAAADYLGMSHQSLALYRSKGTGPMFSKVGQIVRYDRSDLDEWLEAAKR